MTAASETSPGATRLTTKEKLCYGIGDVSNGLAVSSVSLWYMYYLTDVAGVAAILAGVAVTIGRFWDAITDPIMGWISDHTKSRWGKRLPYLLFGAIPYALSYWALWVVPDFESEYAAFVYVTIALIAFNTFLTIVFVPYASLTAAITSDYNERTSITGFRMVCSQVAFLIGASVPPLVASWVISGDGFTWFHDLFGAWAKTPREGYFVTGGIFAVVMVCSIWTTFFGTTERDYTPHTQPQKSSPLSYAVTIFSELLGNRPFLYSVLILLLSNSAATLAAANLPYYLRYVLNLQDQFSAITFCLFFTAILSVPVWVLIAKRYGKAETYRVSMVLYILVLCVMPFLEPGIGRWIYLVAAGIGFFHAAALTLPWAIVPDVVEYDELKSGSRREGLFFGGTTFSYKAATGVAFLVSAGVLQLSGYEPNVEQSTTALNALRFLIGPAPALFLAAGAFLALRYPLTAEKHRLILQELELRKKSPPLG